MGSLGTRVSGRQRTGRWVLGGHEGTLPCRSRAPGADIHRQFLPQHVTHGLNLTADTAGPVGSRAHPDPGQSLSPPSHIRSAHATSELAASAPGVHTSSPWSVPGSAPCEGPALPWALESTQTPPAGHLPAARNPQGRGQMPPGAREPRTSLWGPRSPGLLPGTPGFLPLPGLFGALPQPLSCSGGPGQTVPTACSLPRLGPAPPHPRAPAAPPCGQGGRPRSPGSHVGATRSCYRYPAPRSTGLWARWVGFRPLPAKPHCKNRGTACSRGAKGGGSASQHPQRDPGRRSGQPHRGALGLGWSSVTALPSSPELGAAPGWQDSLPVHSWPRGTSASPGPPQGGVVPP